MMRRFRLAIPLLGLAALAIIARGQEAPYATSGEAGMALNDATRALADARARAQRLDQEAAAASAAADHTAQDAAALAAKIQQAQAEIGVAQARIALIDQDRGALRAQIAAREVPLVRLTAALQLMARRPLVFSVVRSDSLDQTVWLRATLETMLPQVAQRTAALRAQIVRGRQLQEQARQWSASLSQSQHDLAARQTDLIALESRQRIASRAASGNAARESDRVLALAEQTRDLNALIAQLQADDTLAAQLARLPGPVPRPDDAGSGHALTLPDMAAPTTAPLAATFSGILPVAGRLVSGFGASDGAGAQHGITIAPAAGAQAVAPAAGRVAFAGAYRGYGHIVIIQHDGGWSSLVTGLGRIDVAVGDTVVQGAPLGVAEPGHPRVTVELRKDGRPVNPTDFLHG